MSATTDAMSHEETGRLAQAYGEAWNAHDVDALLSMQADDMAFHLHLDGVQEVVGTAALRELFSYFFVAMPDYRAEVTRTTIRDGLIVLEYVIHATLEHPLPLGGVVGVPTGKPLAFEAVDVLHCVGGRMTRKDTYVDGWAMRKNLGA